MTKEDLVKKLRDLKQVVELAEHDPERSHWMADKLLIEFIGDPEISEAYEDLTRYCA